MAESKGVWYITPATYQQLKDKAGENWNENGCPFEASDFDKQLGSMFPTLNGNYYATMDEIDEEELEWADNNDIVIGTTTFQNSGQSIGILPNP